MRKGVARHKLETMIVASGKSGLQTVVRRTVKVREVVDLSEIGESRSKGQGAICARSRRSLIEINDAGKLYRVIANVGDVKRKFARERMLDAQSPILYVGCSEVAIHGEGVARNRVHSTRHIGAVTALNKGRERRGIDGRRLVLPVHATRARPCEVDGGGENVSNGRFGDRGNRASIISHHSYRTSRNGSPGRNNAYAKQYRPALQVLLRQEGAHGDDIVNDAAAKANDSGAFTRNIPGDTHARREILAVSLVDGTDVFAHLFKADRRLPVSEQIVVFRRDALELVTQPEIEGHALGNAPVILGVAGIQPLRDVADGISTQNARLRWIALKEVLETSKRNAASPAAEGTLMNQIPANLAAEFEGVLAAQIRDLVDKAVDLVWPDDLRKVVESSQFRERGELDIRYAAQEIG